jgi:hypothetical protein
MKKLKFPKNPKDCTLEILEEFAVNLVVMARSLPEDRVRLSVWQSNKSRLAHETAQDLVNDCGSTACLGGWAALYPPLQAMGFSAGFSGHPLINNRRASYYLNDFSYSLHRTHVGFKDLRGQINCIFEAQHNPQISEKNEAVQRAESLLETIRKHLNKQKKQNAT